MQFISENIINQILETFEQQETFLEKTRQLWNEQPDLAEFVDGENQGLLNESELGLLRFLTTLIYTACHQESAKTKLSVPGKVLENCEEKNWEIFNDQTNKSFRAILDVFFLEYAQEDLLALVEDTLQDEEDEAIVTSIGREIIFIACKSIIDTIDLSN